MPNGTLVWNEARDRGLEKWERGQREHGGDLYRKPTLDEAIDEAIDLIPYLFIHRAHVRRALVHLKAIELRLLPPAVGDAILAAINLIERGNVEGETA